MFVLKHSFKPTSLFLKIYSSKYLLLGGFFALSISFWPYQTGVMLTLGWPERFSSRISPLNSRHHCYYVCTHESLNMSENCKSTMKASLKASSSTSNFNMKHPLAWWLWHKENLLWSNILLNFICHNSKKVL